ncbi:trichothecene c-8 hydroxylase [Colletotrichum truncatum]|uniref:Trichothecene c-8 hydroxylase n=1 Tax=Colletotrichum truncatum TaxID=5467 RepID=A0ACC3ZD73_COLTU
MGLLFMLIFYGFDRRGVKIPEINPAINFDIGNRRRMADFVQNSKDLMIRARQKFGQNPYKLFSEWGNVVVLPPEYLDELRNDPRLDILTPLNEDNNGSIPGFEPFMANENHPLMITKYLTRALNKITKPLSKEMALTLREIITETTGNVEYTLTEWHEIVPGESFIHIVNRLSTRVFMGEDLCRDDAWLKASANYTATAFAAGKQLGRYPKWFRPIVHWFLPSCWKVRGLLSHTRQVLKPHLERREAKKNDALAQGDTSIQFDDAIEWFGLVFKEKYDPASQQITLALAAIHTTNDLLQQTMIDLACHPELFKPLREELISVLRADGLTKTALPNLKLLDSVIKESQRLKPVMLSNFRRLATENIRLSDGFVIRKGQRIIVNNTHMWDTNWYEEPEKYDGYRFLHLRGTEQEKYAHLVNTATKHTGFGFGNHSCPGRFFAANELKIALIHFLLKYDWKLSEGYKPQPVASGMALVPDPRVKFLFRRREQELDLVCL